MKLSQSYQYTGSSEFTFENVLLGPTGIALFDQRTGIGGVDFIPYHGSTVTVKAGDPSTQYFDFSPSLNNKIYYLVTDQEYSESDRATIKSLGTAINVHFNGTDYQGDFVFQNPNDYEYLYLMWDYEDSIGTGTASFKGIVSSRSIALDLGTDIGLAGVNYQAVDLPVRFRIRWNNTDVIDSGYVGLNSIANYNALIAAGVSASDIKLQSPYDGTVNNGTGSLLFDKFSSLNDAQVVVDSPLASSVWIVNRVMPSLKSFFIDITNGTTANVCTQCPTTQYYHNGVGLLPTINDRIYTASDGSSLYDGASAFHMIDTVTCTVPSSTGKSYVGVDSSGNVTSIDPCDCPEFAVPFIYQEDIVINSLEDVNIPISVYGNPTSFTVVTTCLEYLLDGGSSSTLFTYTDCDSNTNTITVSAFQAITVCASSAPTITRGDGSVSSGISCLSSIFPSVLSFNNGVISGRSVKELSFSFTINATNCFAYTFNRLINRIKPCKTLPINCRQLVIKVINGSWVLATTNVFMRSIRT